MGAPSPTARAEELARADLSAARGEYLFPAPRWLVEYGLQDSRDAAPASLVLNVALLVLPAAVGLHLWREVPHWVGAVYLIANYAVFLQVSASEVAHPRAVDGKRRSWRRPCNAGARAAARRAARDPAENTPHSPPKQRFMLTLHFTEHRRLWRQGDWPRRRARPASGGASSP
jgi:hypothetical protein